MHRSKGCTQWLKYCLLSQNGRGGQRVSNQGNYHLNAKKSRINKISKRKKKAVQHGGFPKSTHPCNRHSNQEMERFQVRCLLLDDDLDLSPWDSFCLSLNFNKWSHLKCSRLSGSFFLFNMVPHRVIKVWSTAIICSSLFDIPCIIIP